MGPWMPTLAAMLTLRSVMPSALLGFPMIKPPSEESSFQPVVSVVYGVPVVKMRSALKSSEAGAICSVPAPPKVVLPGVGVSEANTNVPAEMVVVPE